MLAACLALLSAAAPAASTTIAHPPGRIEGRGYELVSQPRKDGYEVGEAMPISSDGSHALYELFAGGAPGSTSGQAVLMASRSATGWTSRNALPARLQMAASSYFPVAATARLDGWIASAFEGFGTTDQAPEETVARLDGAGGQQLLRTFPTFFGGLGLVAVTSEDLEHVLVAVPRGADPALPGYLPGALSPRNADVFDLGADPPALVSAMPLSGRPPACGLNSASGTMDFPGGAANALSEHWISTDGARAFFSTSGDACTDPRQLYARDLPAGTTARVSGPPLPGDPDNGIDRFLQATPDGSEAFFRTATSYDPDDDADGDSSDRDVYRWSARNGALACVTCAIPHADVPAATNLVANAVISEDGSHVYFPSAAQGAGAPAPGTSDAPNLYVWRARDGSVQDIGRITVQGIDGLADVPYIGGQATPDGNVLIFRANRPELDAASGSDNGGTYQYYRWDDVSRTLTCLSCPPAGTAALDVPTALLGGNPPPAFAAHARAVTDDGATVFFPTQNALTPADVNRSWDIYEWHDGDLGLITNGLTHYPGSVQPDPVGASADGRDFLFEDPTPLTWDAQDSSYKLYDARVGGSFPAPPAQPGCTEDECQGPSPAAPALLDPGSAALLGAGNVARAAVLRPTAAALARAARSGRLTLVVRVGGAGRLAGFARARLARRVTVVARGAARTRRPGAVRLTLALSRAARAQLAASGRLRLLIAVRFSRGPVLARLRVTLRASRR